MCSPRCTDDVAAANAYGEMWSKQGPPYKVDLHLFLFLLTIKPVILAIFLVLPNFLINGYKFYDYCKDSCYEWENCNLKLDTNIFLSCNLHDFIDKNRYYLSIIYTKNNHFIICSFVQFWSSYIIFMKNEMKVHFHEFFLYFAKKLVFPPNFTSQEFFFGKDKSGGGN